MTDELLDILGNSTRRKILFLLAERPRFVTELSEQLNIGRKAIIEHLNRLEDAGLVVPTNKSLSKGRPRKYYEITDELFLNISVTPSFVDFSRVESTKEIPEIEKMDMDLDDLENAPLSERRIAVSYILNKMETRLEELESEWVEVQRLLNRARKVLNQ